MDLMNPADEWDSPTTMKNRISGLDAAAKQAPASSCFTAINQQPAQNPTPLQSSAPLPVLQNQARRRNPAVASYLGLGASQESGGLEHEYLLSMPNILTSKKPKRKRRSQQSESNAPVKKANTANKKPPKQRRTTKHGKQTMNPTPDLTCEGLQQPLPSTNTPLVPFDDPFCKPGGLTRCASHDSAIGRDSNTRTVSSQEVPVAPPTKSFVAVGFSDLKGNFCDGFDTLSLEHDSHEHQCDASIFDDDNSFDDELDDSDLLALVPEMAGEFGKDASRTGLPTTSSAAQSIDPKTYDPGSSTDIPIMLDDLDDDASQYQCVAKKFVSPVTITTRLLAMPSNETHEPIVRSPFPSHVHDRSPIIGLTSNALLRTCFRIGEAINQCSLASKSGKSITVELYARVLDSARDNYQQRFTFCDLFHAKPPYIKARYSAAIWKLVPLFDYDSRRLLQEGRVCRCIGTMKRNEREWKMTVLNIWEATWEDIEWAKGIVDS